MSQVEILDWLIAQRRGGNDQFFSTKEIGNGVKSVGGSNLRVFVQVRKLDCYLDCEYVNLHLHWRVKDKYV
jgi:hypothetical protein